MKVLPTLAALLLVAGALAQPATPGKGLPSKDKKWVKKLEQQVNNATLAWATAVTSVRTGKSVEEAAEATAAFYAPYAVFFATLSAGLRTTPPEILAYFKFFTALPDLRVEPGKYQPFTTIYDHRWARNDGYIQLSYKCCSDPASLANANAPRRFVNARWSFAYRYVNKKWMIVEHHNSVVPAQPATLASVTEFVPSWAFTPIPDTCVCPS